MTGYGTYTWSDGTKIIGFFDNGICNKHGKKIYPDGRTYIGEFQNDVENGKGILIHNGVKVSGIWKDAQLVQKLVQQTLDDSSDVAKMMDLMNNRIGASEAGSMDRNLQKRDPSSLNVDLPISFPEQK